MSVSHSTVFLCVFLISFMIIFVFFFQMNYRINFGGCLVSFTYLTPQNALYFNWCGLFCVSLVDCLFVCVFGSFKFLSYLGRHFTYFKQCLLRRDPLSSQKEW